MIIPRTLSSRKRSNTTAPGRPISAEEQRAVDLSKWLWNYTINQAIKRTTR